MKICLYVSGVILALGLSSKNLGNTGKKIFSAVLLMILVILMAEYSLNYSWDNRNYQNTYNLVCSNDYEGTTEAGYLVFNKIGSILGLDYLAFRYFYFIFFVTLFYYSIKRLTDSYGMFYVFYFLYPVFKDAEQIRIFAAYVLIIFGSYYLCLKKKSYVKYLLCCLFASLFHVSAVSFVFLLVPDLPGRYKKSMIKIMTAASMIFVVLFLSARSLFIGVLQKMVLLIDAERGGAYIHGSSRSGFLVPAIIFSVLFFISWTAERSMEDMAEVHLKRMQLTVSRGMLYRRGTYTDVKREIYLSRILSVMAVLTIPFTTMNLHFYRLGRMFAMYILIAVLGNMEYVKCKDRYKIYIGVLVILAGFLFFDFYMFGPFSNLLALFVK